MKNEHKPNIMPKIKHLQPESMSTGEYVNGRVCQRESMSTGAMVGKDKVEYFYFYVKKLSI